jgi:hypothetical protein
MRWLEFSFWIEEYQEDGLGSYEWTPTQWDVE